MANLEPEKDPDKPATKKPAPNKDWVKSDKVSKRIDKEVSDARGTE